MSVADEETLLFIRINRWLLANRSAKIEENYTGHRHTALLFGKKKRNDSKLSNVTLTL